MSKNDILKLSFVKEKHKGIIDIYTHKAMNSFLLDGVIASLSKTHTLVKIFDGLIRAFEN